MRRRATIAGTAAIARCTQRPSGAGRHGCVVARASRGAEPWSPVASSLVTWRGRDRLRLRHARRWGEPASAGRTRPGAGGRVVARRPACRRRRFSCSGQKCLCPPIAHVVASHPSCYVLVQSSVAHASRRHLPLGKERKCRTHATRRSGVARPPPSELQSDIFSLRFAVRGPHFHAARLWFRQEFADDPSHVPTALRRSGHRLSRRQHMPSTSRAWHGGAEGWRVVVFLRASCSDFEERDTACPRLWGQLRAVSSGGPILDLQIRVQVSNHVRLENSPWANLA